MIFIKSGRKNIMLALLILAFLLLQTAACTGPAAQPVSNPSTTHAATSAGEAPRPTPSDPTPTPAGRLNVRLIYPGDGNPLEKGQSTRFIVSVEDERGEAVNEAQTTLTLLDAEGEVLDVLQASAGAGDAYRSDYWTVPNTVPAGEWGIEIEARTQEARGSLLARFEVENSISDVFLSKYGFWLDAPELRGIAPQVAAEKGDARNGMIRWGGVKPALHIMAENWVDVHWREGDYGLESDQDVRRFLLEELGELGFAPARSLGPFEPFRFKGWDGWRGESRGEMKEDLIEWVVFYAPEVDKTYAINTTVVLPPSGNAHAVLRDSFAVFPEVRGDGVAPEPLPDLLPGPELLGPPLAARFQGLGEPIVLRWAPVKELAEDEYYEVTVDFYYKEDNPKFRFATRGTELTLPDSLYHTPNCSVFNWRVTLNKQTGVDENGQPIGTPISFNSLYWYLWWSHAPGEEEFPVACPYTHLD